MVDEELKALLTIERVLFKKIAKRVVWCSMGWGIGIMMLWLGLITYPVFLVAVWFGVALICGGIAALIILLELFYRSEPIKSFKNRLITYFRGIYTPINLLQVVKDVGTRNAKSILYWVSSEIRNGHVRGEIDKDKGIYSPNCH